MRLEKSLRASNQEHCKLPSVNRHIEIDHVHLLWRQGPKRPKIVKIYFEARAIRERQVLQGAPPLHQQSLCWYAQFSMNDQKLSFTFANIWLDNLDKEFVTLDVAAVANALADCPCPVIRAVVTLPISTPYGKASHDYAAALDCDCGKIRKTFVRPFRVIHPPSI